MMTSSLVDRIAALQDQKRYEDLHWSGSFEDYLEIARRNPRVARTAYERLYDMVLSHGTEEYVDSKKKITRYRFFRDEAHQGRDAIFGLDIPLMRFVNVLKAAALRYGTERRIILLHGPVGSWVRCTVVSVFIHDHSKGCKVVPTPLAISRTVKIDSMSVVCSPANARTAGWVSTPATTPASRAPPRCSAGSPSPPDRWPTDPARRG